MRFLVQVLVIIIAIAAFGGGLLINTRSNFVAGFLAVGLLWVGKALISDLSAESDLADRVAKIFMLHNKAILLLVLFLLSGLVGGLAAMSGGALRKEPSDK